jgi:serine protease AprX
VAVLIIGFASNSFAEGGNGRRTRVRPGQGNYEARNHQKLDKELTFRSERLAASAKTRVIVSLKPGAELPAEFKAFQRRNGKLGIINGRVLNLPNGVIKRLAEHPDVFDIRYDRPLAKTNYTTTLTTGSYAATQGMGLTGAGVGVAVIDSGIAPWHNDLTNRSTTLYPYGDQRVSAFVDFVNGQIAPYDDEGHGTHVAGILAGNGFDSDGRHSGVAPDASLVVLKVLDANGQGTISDMIAALDWVLANHAQYNIRVVNMSVGAGISESYMTDPVTLAAKRVVDAGIVVVAAAGNNGRNLLDQAQYGGILAPGNAPWVLTVGGSSHEGTANRADDVMASFSSRGPTYKDYAAKPDLVAPGKGSLSLADPWGTFYWSKSQFLSDGSGFSPFKSYLSLSGTSMSAPVVSGTVALMLQANPSLTPNAVKAILQYTAQVYPGYDALTQGAGFLNALGAVRLAKFYATAQPGQEVPAEEMWGKRIIWGNHLLSGGVLDPSANAFGLAVQWGVAKTNGDDNIVWGTMCGDASCDNIVWGTNDDNIVWGTMGDDNIVWGTNDDNIVWGTDCGGDDCDNIVWGTNDDNIVWGTADADDNIVWGTNDDNIVWGTDHADLDNIVWGTDNDDNIVWGTNGDDNIVWGTNGDDNIVWGTDQDDNIVWGTVQGGQIFWASSASGTVTPLRWHEALNVLSDEQLFTVLTSLGAPAPAVAPPPASDPGVPPAPVDSLPPPPMDVPPPTADPGVPPAPMDPMPPPPPSTDPLPLPAPLPPDPLPPPPADLLPAPVPVPGGGI